MTAPDVVELGRRVVRVEDGPVRLKRRSGGISSYRRPLYYWHAVCVCGWSDTSNLPKRDQQRRALSHVRDAHRQDVAALEAAPVRS